MHSQLGPFPVSEVSRGDLQHLAWAKGLHIAAILKRQAEFLQGSSTKSGADVESLLSLLVGL